MAKTKKRSMLIIYIVLALIVLAFVAGSVYAKYVFSKNGDGTLTAKSFYFSSDYLTADGAEYDLNPGTTSVSFTLKNCADDLRFAEDDIAYTVTSTGGTLSAENGTLTGGEVNSEMITLSGLQPGKSYTVTAVGKAGYQQTLSATFEVLADPQEAYLNLSSTDNYVLLTVWTRNLTGEAVISFPAGLIPDNTDPVMAGIANYNKDTFAYDAGTLTDAASFGAAYSSHTYRFFKETVGQPFTASQFTVTVGGKTASLATPS